MPNNSVSKNNVITITIQDGRGLAVYCLGRWDPVNYHLQLALEFICFANVQHVDIAVLNDYFTLRLVSDNTINEHKIKKYNNNLHKFYYFENF